MPGRGFRAPAELGQHFRTYFIALTANTNTTMHYNVTRTRHRLPSQELHAVLHDARRSAAPPGVQQGDGPLLRRR